MRLHFVPDPSKDMSRALLNPHHTHQLNIPIPRHPRGAGFFDKDSFPSIGPSLVHTHTQMADAISIAMAISVPTSDATAPTWLVLNAVHGAYARSRYGC